MSEMGDIVDSPYLPHVKDFFLKFATEKEADDTLYEEIYRIEYTPDPDDPENIIETQVPTGEYRPLFMNIDTIGLIYEPTGNMLTDEDGNEYPEMAPIDGWHINVRVMGGEDPTPILPYSIPVNTPVRIWLGGKIDPDVQEVSPL